MVRETDSPKPVLTHTFILPVTYSYMVIEIKKSWLGASGKAFPWSEETITGKHIRFPLVMALYGCEVPNCRSHLATSLKIEKQGPKELQGNRISTTRLTQFITLFYVWVSSYTISYISLLFTLVEFFLLLDSIYILLEHRKIPEIWSTLKELTA